MAPDGRASRELQGYFPPEVIPNSKGLNKTLGCDGSSERPITTSNYFLSSVRVHFGILRIRDWSLGQICTAKVVASTVDRAALKSLTERLQAQWATTPSNILHMALSENCVPAMSRSESCPHFIYFLYFPYFPWPSGANTILRQSHATTALILVHPARVLRSDVVAANGWCFKMSVAGSSPPPMAQVPAFCHKSRWETSRTGTWTSCGAQFLRSWCHVLSLHDLQSRTDFGCKFEMRQRSSATAEGEVLPPSWTNIFLQRNLGSQGFQHDIHNHLQTVWAHGGV